MGKTIGHAEIISDPYIQGFEGDVYRVEGNFGTQVEAQAAINDLHSRSHTRTYNQITDNGFQLNTTYTTRHEDPKTGKVNISEYNASTATPQNVMVREASARVGNQWVMMDRDGKSAIVVDHAQIAGKPNIRSIADLKAALPAGSYRELTSGQNMTLANGQIVNFNNGLTWVMEPGEGDDGNYPLFYFRADHGADKNNHNLRSVHVWVRGEDLLSDDVKPHGIVGQTADGDGEARSDDPSESFLASHHNGEGVIEGSVDDYEVQGLFGMDYKYNRFNG